MNYFKKIIFTSFIIFILARNLSCIKNNKLIITKLHPYSEVDTVGDKLHKYNFYLVQNFEFENKLCFQELKQFAETHLDQDYANYAKYTIEFFRESSKTPISFKQTQSDLILWHGDDLIYTFVWDHGKFIYYNAYKDDKIIK